MSMERGRSDPQHADPAGHDVGRQIRWNGRVDNTGDGKIDMAHLSLAGANVLSVEGCSLGGLVCGGEN